VDVISPCVTFNDHEGSTKSYAYTREHNVEIVQADFVPPATAITADYEAGSVRNVMMHDGWVRLRKVAEDYDPTDRDRAYAFIRDAQSKGEVVTGLLYIDEGSQDMHGQAGTVTEPLTSMPCESLCPATTSCRSCRPLPVGHGLRGHCCTLVLARDRHALVRCSPCCLRRPPPIPPRRAARNRAAVRSRVSRRLVERYLKRSWPTTRLDCRWPRSGVLGEQPTAAVGDGLWNTATGLGEYARGGRS
jgi:hypothetical protein